jgi:hypothetical protein
MWNGNLAKFIWGQIVGVLMCTADLGFRFGSHASVQKVPGQSENILPAKAQK